MVAERVTDIEGTKLVTGSIPVPGGIVTAGVAGGLSLEIHRLAYQEQFRAYCRSHGGMISSPAKIILTIDVRRA